MVVYMGRLFWNAWITICCSTVVVGCWLDGRLQVEIKLIYCISRPLASVNDRLRFVLKLLNMDYVIVQQTITTLAPTRRLIAAVRSAMECETSKQ